MGPVTCKHRKNKDNSWDSICPRCSLIIARVKQESDLTVHELLHDCDPALFRKAPSVGFHLTFAR
jgi:hypothetical protein